jgi:hypothetical protein
MYVQSSGRYPPTRHSGVPRRIQSEVSSCDVWRAVIIVALGEASLMKLTVYSTEVLADSVGRLWPKSKGTWSRPALTIKN